MKRITQQRMLFAQHTKSRSKSTFMAKPYPSRQGGLSRRGEDRRPLPLTTHFYAHVSLQQGIGVSLVNNAPEELLYVSLVGVNATVKVVPARQDLTLLVQKLQVDNQLLNASVGVLLQPVKATAASRGEEFGSIFNSEVDSGSEVDPIASRFLRKPDLSSQPMLYINVIRKTSDSKLYEVFRKFCVRMNRFKLLLEERNFYRVLLFFGIGQTTSEQDSDFADELKADLYRTTSIDSFTTMKRYYFDELEVDVLPFVLGFITSYGLAPEEKAIKDNVSLSYLLQFQNVALTVRPYRRANLFETSAFVTNELKQHFIAELSAQGMRIVLSVDAIGDPLGLAKDVTEGLSNLLQGNVPDMILNVTHGVTETVGKFAGTVSTGFAKTLTDKAYREKRIQIQSGAKNSSEHVVVAFQSLVQGMIGGLTSAVTTPVKVVQKEGLATGVVLGVVKGAVESIVKPIQGVLDFTASGLSAVRVATANEANVSNVRCRETRNCNSLQGCLPVYSREQAYGQRHLYDLNQKSLDETLYNVVQLTGNEQSKAGMLILIANHTVYVIKKGEPYPEATLLMIHYYDIVRVTVHETENKSYIEIEHREPNDRLTVEYAHLPEMNFRIKKPRISCSSPEAATHVKQLIDVAKMLLHEQHETVSSEDPSQSKSDDNFQLLV